MSDTILLVDDDKEVLSLNKTYFSKAGYTVATASNAKEALAYLNKYSFSCIILDVMMPEIDGFSFCKTVRNHSDVPIIFLSGKASEDDRIEGLLLGADDYITKPYSLRELEARIKVNIRRHQINQSNKQSSASTLEFPPLTIDLVAHKVFWSDDEITLSNREFDLLHYLASRVNEVCTFEDIGTAVWGAYLENDRRSIMVNVSRLRKKLDAYAGASNMIESVWSKGYTFISH